MTASAASFDMDFPPQITEIVAAALGGGVVVKLIDALINRKKVHAEADAVQATANETREKTHKITLEGVALIVDQLQDQLKEQVAMTEVYRDKYYELSNIVDDLKERTNEQAEQIRELQDKNTTLTNLATALGVKLKRTALGAKMLADQVKCLNEEPVFEPRPEDYE